MIINPLHYHGTKSPLFKVVAKFQYTAEEYISLIDRYIPPNQTDFWKKHSLSLPARPKVSDSRSDGLDGLKFKEIHAVAIENARTFEKALNFNSQYFERVDDTFVGPDYLFLSSNSKSWYSSEVDHDLRSGIYDHTKIAFPIHLREMAVIGVESREHYL